MPPRAPWDVGLSSMWRNTVQRAQRKVVALLLPLLLGCTFAITPAQAQSDLEQGSAAFERGAFESAVESLTRAARTAEKSRDTSSQISALVRLGDAYAALGRYRHAAAALDGALSVAEKSGEQSR